MTPKTMNSLTAIAGHEGDEEEWEKEIGGYVVPEEEASLQPFDFGMVSNQLYLFSMRKIQMNLYLLPTDPPLRILLLLLRLLVFVAMYL